MHEIFERHLRASASTDLTPTSDRSDVDLLTAAGFVAQNHPLGVALYKLKYKADESQTERCLRAVYAIARRYMECHRFKGKALDVAREVLVWWVDDICTHCQGRKLQLIPETNRLSSKPCAVCRGSGIKPLVGDNYEVRRHVAMQLEILLDDARSAMQRIDR